MYRSCGVMKVLQRLYGLLKIVHYVLVHTTSSVSITVVPPFGDMDTLEKLALPVVAS